MPRNAFIYNSFCTLAAFNQLPPLIIGYFSVFGEHLSKGEKKRNGEQLKVEYILGI